RRCDVGARIPGPIGPLRALMAAIGAAAGDPRPPGRREKGGPETGTGREDRAHRPDTPCSVTLGDRRGVGWAPGAATGRYTSSGPTAGAQAAPPPDPPPGGSAGPNSTPAHSLAVAACLNPGPARRRRPGEPPAPALPLPLLPACTPTPWGAAPRSDRPPPPLLRRSGLLDPHRRGPARRRAAPATRSPARPARRPPPRPPAPPRRRRRPAPRPRGRPRPGSAARPAPSSAVAACLSPDPVGRRARVRPPAPPLPS